MNEMAVNNTQPVSAGPNDVAVQQSLGNVAALTAFTGMLRAPVSRTYLLNGSSEFKQVGCTSCHRLSLTTRIDPEFRIQLAKPASGCNNNDGSYLLESFAEANADVHPAVLAANSQKESLSVKGSTCPRGFYCIDLTHPIPESIPRPIPGPIPQSTNVSLPRDTLPAEFYPRLAANADGSVTVPLLSDLKRHDMGIFLRQKDSPQADDSGNTIPNKLWLTSKLWGVADAGPWMHDGRARTLREAILMHAGKDGTDQDGEASPVIGRFLALSQNKQQAIIDFLNKLTVPASPP